MSRLDDLGIRKMVEGPGVTLYVRGNCVAAVGGTQGSTGLMTEHGLAYVVWREGAALLVSKGGETRATEEELEEVRRFTEDLKSALSK